MYFVKRAAGGKTPCQLGLNVQTIATLLVQCDIDPYNKNRKIRSDGAVRRLLKKNLREVAFWCSHPSVAKKHTVRMPNGRTRITREMIPEKRFNWREEWQRDVVPEYALAEKEGIAYDL